MTLTALTLLLISSSALLGAKGAPKKEELNLAPRSEAQLESGSGRIINGTTAVDAQFPHQIALFLNGKFTCGGSIISQTFILTAAHCIVNQGTYTIRAGSRFRTQGKVYSVKRHIKHQKYIGKDDHFRNDVGLLELATPLVLGPNVRIIPLESKNAQVGQIVITSGWGMTLPDTPSSIPEELQYLEMRVVGEVPWPQFAGQFGAYATHGQGICMGDSGGPVITQQETLIGVNSFVHKPCGNSRKPDGFAHVPYYISWIKQYVH